MKSNDNDDSDYCQQCQRQEMSFGEYQEEIWDAFMLLQLHLMCIHMRNL